jgi:hypothetical protein
MLLIFLKAAGAITNQFLNAGVPIGTGFEPLLGTF